MAYQGESVLFEVPTYELLNTGLSVELFDADDDGDVSLGSCSFAVFELDFGGEPTSSYGDTGDFDFHFKLLLME
jgi:hypothetical protein